MASENGERPAIRLETVDAVLVGVLQALEGVGASPAERASIAQTVYLTVMLNIARRQPENLTAVLASFREMAAQLSRVAGHETVAGLEDDLRRASQQSVFRLVEAKVVG